MCVSIQQDRGPSQHRGRQRGVRGQRGVAGHRGGGGEHRSIERRDQPGELSPPPPGDVTTETPLSKQLLSAVSSVIPDRRSLECVCVCVCSLLSSSCAGRVWRHRAGGAGGAGGRGKDMAAGMMSSIF